MAARLTARMPAPSLVGASSVTSTPTKNDSTPLRSNKSPAKKKEEEESPYKIPRRAQANNGMGTRSKDK
jgi:hypothetical protein